MASGVVSGRPSPSSAFSRPPMKRAEGTGSPSALMLMRVSRAASSGRGRAPTARAITQVPVESTENGAGRDSRCGNSEALESWMPTWTGAACGRPVRGSDLRQEGAEAIGGLGQRRKRPRQPRRSTMGEKPRRCGDQRSGVAAERGRLAHRDAGEAKTPILRVHQQRAGFGEGAGGKCAAASRMRAEIEAHGQARRAGSSKPGRIMS